MNNNEKKKLGNEIKLLSFLNFLFIVFVKFFFFFIEVY